MASRSATMQRIAASTALLAGGTTVEWMSLAVKEGREGRHWPFAVTAFSEVPMPRAQPTEDVHPERFAPDC